MNQPGIETWSLGPLVNTLLIRPMARLDCFKNLRNETKYVNVKVNVECTLFTNLLAENNPTVVQMLLNSFNQSINKTSVY